jgi:hypothetical protein
MKTTKSPKRILEMGLACAQRALPRFAHRFSPKKFTQHQLFACLGLKEFLKLDYRGVMQLLIDSPDLCRIIQLDEVPHWTTLQKAADRLLKKTPLRLSSIKRSRWPAKRGSSRAAARA